MPSKRSGAKWPAKLESREDLRLSGSRDNGDSAGEKEGLAPTTPRTTDPWRAKQLNKKAHQLQQLNVSGDGVVALCHCGWQSMPTTTERRAHNAFKRHEAAPSA